MEYDHVDKNSLGAALQDFQGTIDQIPPIYSAIRKDGKRLYDQARQGVSEKDLQLEPRSVTIHQIDLLNFHSPQFELAVECGGGTYIRSLVRDIGQSLGTVATMTALERTKQGPFGIADCLVRDEWTTDKIIQQITHFNNALPDRILAE